MRRHEKRCPFLLKPAAKDYLWGGTRLNDDFKKEIDVTPLAETWECSTHPDGSSTIEKTGGLLADFLGEHPDYIGEHPLRINGGRAELPILIKFIDAKSDLSIQVHPDDEYAMCVEHSLGKTELWYVLDAKPDAKLVYGLRRDMDEEAVRCAIKNGTIEQYLNHISVQKNDLFYIKPGTIHAIGAGCLIAEIQESSNITYRLYDYERKDANGVRRPLHIERALEVANLKSSVSPRQPMRVLKYRNGCATELLSRCKYFQVERMLLNTEVHRSLVDFKTESNSFHALLCIDGCGTISEDRDQAGFQEERFMLNFFKGDCIFVPADSIALKLHGKAQLLDVSC